MMKVSSRAILAIAGSAVFGVACATGSSTEFIAYREPLAKPQFVLVVDNPRAPRTPRSGNRALDRNWFELLRLEISDPDAVATWKERFQPTPAGDAQQRPIQPWIFGYFNDATRTIYFESDGCVTYSEESGLAGAVNAQLVGWISDQVDISGFEDACLVPPSRHPPR